MEGRKLFPLPHFLLSFFAIFASFCSNWLLSFAFANSRNIVERESLETEPSPLAPG